jgi:DNA-binding IclR family transcriptional regulator
MHNKQIDNFELLPKEILEGHPQFASTLGNGLDVLQCFTTQSLSLSNKEISEKLALAKPTISRLTFTLVAMGFLCRDKSTGRYSLGPGVLTLGYPLLIQLNIREIAAQDMIDLSKLVKGPVSLGIRDRLQVVYIETTYNRYRSNAHPDIGSARPLLSTAIGRALLYTHTQAELELILDKLKIDKPEECVKFGKKLEQSFDEIRAHGFCTSYGEWRQNLYGIAVPFKNKINGQNLAMNITVPSHQANIKQIESEYGPRLVDLVQNLQSKVGG